MQAPHASFDLHVLSVPPAFILSQDQTLVKIFLELLKFQVIDVGMYLVLTCLRNLSPDSLTLDVTLFDFQCACVPQKGVPFSEAR